jgi:hypothetical protein
MVDGNAAIRAVPHVAETVVVHDGMGDAINKCGPPDLRKEFHLRKENVTCQFGEIGLSKIRFRYPNY